jgi:hypothetical protein
MTASNEYGQSWRAGWAAAREAGEKRDPLFTIFVIFGVGAALVARAAWEHEIFGIIFSAVTCFLFGPLLASWRHKRNLRRAAAFLAQREEPSSKRQ